LNGRDCLRDMLGLVGCVIWVSRERPMLSNHLLIRPRLARRWCPLVRKDLAWLSSFHIFAEVTARFCNVQRWRIPSDRRVGHISFDSSPIPCHPSSDFPLALWPPFCRSHRMSSPSTVLISSSIRVDYATRVFVMNDMMLLQPSPGVRR